MSVRSPERTFWAMYQRVRCVPQEEIVAICLLFPHWTKDCQLGGKTEVLAAHEEGPLIARDSRLTGCPTARSDKTKTSE